MTAIEKWIPKYCSTVFWKLTGTGDFLLATELLLTLSSTNLFLGGSLKGSSAAVTLTFKSPSDQGPFKLQILILASPNSSKNSVVVQLGYRDNPAYNGAARMVQN